MQPFDRCMDLLVNTWRQQAPSEAPLIHPLDI